MRESNTSTCCCTVPSPPLNADKCVWSICTSGELSEVGNVMHCTARLRLKQRRMKLSERIGGNGTRRIAPNSYLLNTARLRLTLPSCSTPNWNGCGIHGRRQ